jgi:signal peptidase I
MAEAGNSSSLLRDYGGTVLIAVVVALLIRFFLIEAYRIPSPAMRPTLEPGDTIFVEKWPFGLRLPWTDDPLTTPRRPRHGEVVVFTFEGAQTRDYIKRVLGLPGDTVEVQNGIFLLNGKSTEVPGTRKADCATETTPEGTQYGVCFDPPLIENFAPKVVPENSFFVLGDFRGRTDKEVGADKNIHAWGIFPMTSLRGSALWLWLSLDPGNRGSANGLFPSIRFDRMFRRIQ